MADALKRISHRRAISNLSGRGGCRPGQEVAGGSLDRLNRRETGKMLVEAANGAGMAIVFGNILDTIPGCLVIGAKFTAIGNLSLTLMLGMFLGGIPEAAASASMLTKAGYRPAAIFGLWSTVLIALSGGGCCCRKSLHRQQRRTPWQSSLRPLRAGPCSRSSCPCDDPRRAGRKRRFRSWCSTTVGGFLFALYLALAESVRLTTAQPLAEWI